MQVTTTFVKLLKPFLQEEKRGGDENRKTALLATFLKTSKVCLQLHVFLTECRKRFVRDKGKNSLKKFCHFLFSSGTERREKRKTAVILNYAFSG